jgi:hypothetical protein
MNFDPNNQHAQQVEAWIAGIGTGQSPKTLVHLFEKAILMLWQRSYLTLNEVILSVIFDRALYNSQEKFPLLLALKVDSFGVQLEELVQKIDNYSSSELIEAFQYFLVEVIGIMSNLTGGILTTPLYKELDKVTLENVSSDSNR